MPVLVAGGLHAGNVGELLTRHAPYGVDVASGVEAAPGIKDATKLQAFFEAIRQAGREPHRHSNPTRQTIL
ncbi:N-(5'-phosphoribosyl)anthranilate isomerase [compost metagenome]